MAKNVFVGAHGNSIRALVKHIKQLSDDEIMDVEIPNFPPLVFEFDEKIECSKKNTTLENKLKGIWDYSQVLCFSREEGQGLLEA